MPSPFPGMNPYLEQNDTWEDFHQSFITHARDLLSGEVGPNYLVKIEVRLYLHELPASERRYFGRADSGITARGPTSASATPAPLAAPVHLTLPAVDVERHASLEIRDRRNRRLVTVIELLSPTNKTPGPDRDEYLAKRAQILASTTHLVEIDMRRGGERPRPPALPPCDYYVLVSRADLRPDDLGFWPLGLQDPLPPIKIPLTAPDADVTLDLQALLHQVYDAADYGKYIYSESPQPPLSEDVAGWARQFVDVAS
ncbi:MAG TPA: DUF4058 family protein [Gemmataceae bacterium]|nr:DUF4058 family protein [Gemmataceae bacterium]